MSRARVHILAGADALCGAPTSFILLSSDPADATCLRCMALHCSEQAEQGPAPASEGGEPQVPGACIDLDTIRRHRARYVPDDGTDTPTLALHVDALLAEVVHLQGERADTVAFLRRHLREPWPYDPLFHLIEALERGEHRRKE